MDHRKNAEKLFYNANVVDDIILARRALDRIKVSTENELPVITKSELEAIRIKMKMPADYIPKKLFGKLYIVVSDVVV